MTQWYCFVGGQQYGPVSEEVLRRWIAEGRVRPGDYVWAAGMASWAAAGSIPGLFGPQVAAAARARVPVPPPGGTGGRLGVGEIMSQAWTRMSGRWGLAIGVALLYFLLYNAVNSVPLGALILAGPLTLGAVIFFLTYVRGGNAEIGMLFAGFRNFANALLAFLLMFAFTCLWMLLGVVPGVLAGIAVGAAVEPEVGLAVGAILCAIGAFIAMVLVTLRYSQVFYLLADDPSLGPMEAIRRSIEIMRGNKLRLFALMLVFGLVSLFCMIVICVGWVFLFVFAAPFFWVCYTVFYDDLHPPAAQATAVLPPSQEPGSQDPELTATEPTTAGGTAEKET
ncbi:MAG: hypothetical protein AMJ81_10640 [Phycisphaerae bacterium SM23_33]|nr:MAG: hypothetical protein AMJ81_10640 [Phycisphaerae bacterium SM23_33]